MQVPDEEVRPHRLPPHHAVGRLVNLRGGRVCVPACAIAARGFTCTHDPKTVIGRVPFTIHSWAFVPAAPSLLQALERFKMAQEALKAEVGGGLGVGP